MSPQQPRFTQRKPTTNNKIRRPGFLTGLGRIGVGNWSLSITGRRNLSGLPLKDCFSWSPIHSAAPATEPETVNFIRKVLSFIVNTTECLVSRRRSHGFLCQRQLPLPILSSKVALLCMDDGQSGQFPQSRSERGETNQRDQQAAQEAASQKQGFCFSLCALFPDHPHPNRGA